MILMTDFGGRCGVLIDDEPSWARELDLFLYEWSRIAEEQLAKKRRERKKAQRKVRKQNRCRKHGRR